jgi:integrase
MLRKVFKPAKIVHWTILEKEVVDEIIFRTVKPRNRLMLELMARCGMRVSEVLNLTPRDVEGARAVVVKAGNLVGIHLRPHDLRRHAATHASRSGTPIEIVSKVILRHANLSTTQRYLGKASDVEALRWIENSYA